MVTDKPVAAGVAEPDGDVWEELREEWEAFVAELEAEGANANGEQ